MTAAEAARSLERPERTIRHWLRTGRLAGQKIGRDWVVEESAVAELERALRDGRP